MTYEPSTNMCESIGNIMKMRKETKQIQRSGNGNASSEEDEDKIGWHHTRSRKKKGLVDSAKIDLEIFGLLQNVTDYRLKSESDVIIKDSDLLTKYDAARTDAYNVNVTKMKVEKLQRLIIWAERGAAIHTHI